MRYVAAMNLSELPAQGFKAVDLDGKSVLVGRVDGQIFACLDRCPHSAAPLRIGKLRGEELQCAWHGWIFNVISGCSVPANPAFCLTQFPTKVDGEAVLVGLPSQDS